MSIADNPNTLAGYVRHLGAEVLTGTRTFRFEVPLGEVKRVVPEIYRLGLRCEKVSERTGTDPYNGNAITVATIEIRRPPEEKSEYEQERNLMMAVIR
jgi:hypothetical protein